jgi:hypothetical protein
MTSSKQGKIFSLEPGDSHFSVQLSQNGPKKTVDLCTDVVNHSPTGVALGYLGSGPAQAALSILCELYGKDLKKHPIHYKDFKFDVIACQNPKMPFRITQRDIENYIDTTLRQDVELS